MNLILALAILGGSALMVWDGIEDPEGGAIEGIRRMMAGEPAVKRSSLIGQTFLNNAVAAVSAGNRGGEAAPAVAVTGGGSGTSASGARGAVLAEAETWLGAPYLFGGESRSGVDCSGFTQAVFATVGVSLPRVSAAQALTGKSVSAAQAQPGDLVAFGFPVHHVAIYLGAGQIIHAPHAGTVVRHETIWNTEPVMYRNVLDAGAAVKPARAKRKRKRKTTVAA